MASVLNLTKLIKYTELLVKSNELSIKIPIEEDFTVSYQAAHEVCRFLQNKKIKPRIEAVGECGEENFHFKIVIPAAQKKALSEFNQQKIFRHFKAVFYKANIRWVQYLINRAIIVFQPNYNYFKFKHLIPYYKDPDPSVVSENIYIPLTSGEVIHGYKVEPEPNEESLASKTDYIVMLHGNAELASDLLPALENAAQIGNCTAIAIDYPGYGLSTGLTRNANKLKQSVWETLEHLILEKKATSLTVHAHSVGGFASSEVMEKLQKKYPTVNIRFINSRSGSSLSDTAVSHLGAVKKKSNDENKNKKIEELEKIKIQKEARIQNEIKNNVKEKLQQKINDIKNNMTGVDSKNEINWENAYKRIGQYGFPLLMLLIEFMANRPYNKIQEKCKDINEILDCPYEWVSANDCAKLIREFLLQVIEENKNKLPAKLCENYSIFMSSKGNNNCACSPEKTPKIVEFIEKFTNFEDSYKNAKIDERIEIILNDKEFENYCCIIGDWSFETYKFMVMNAVISMMLELHNNNKLDENLESEMSQFEEKLKEFWKDELNKSQHNFVTYLESLNKSPPVEKSQTCIALEKEMEELNAEIEKLNNLEKLKEYRIGFFKKHVLNVLSAMIKPVLFLVGWSNHSQKAIKKMEKNSCQVISVGSDEIIGGTYAGMAFALEPDSKKEMDKINKMLIRLEKEIKNKTQKKKENLDSLERFVLRNELFKPTIESMKKSQEAFEVDINNLHMHVSAKKLRLIELQGRTYEGNVIYDPFSNVHNQSLDQLTKNLSWDNKIINIDAQEITNLFFSPESRERHALYKENRDIKNTFFGGKKPNVAIKDKNFKKDELVIENKIKEYDANKNKRREIAQKQYKKFMSTKI